MKISLKFKLMLAFFLLISIPLSILGTTSYYKASSSMQSTLEQQLKSDGYKTGNSISQTINSLDKYIQILSLDQKLAKLAEGDSSSTDEVYQYLSELQKQNSDLLEMLAVTNSAGKEIINNSDKIVNIDLGNRDYVKTALNGTPGKSEVIVSQTTKNTVVAIAYPLKLNNKVVGTVIGTINFNNICKELSKLKVGTNGYAYMVDKNGLILYHPDSAKALKENISDIKSSELMNLMDKAKANKSIEGYYTLSGVKKFASFTSVGDWFLIINVDYNDYMSPVFAIRLMTVLIGVFSSILAIILSYFGLTRKILASINTLEKLMTKVGNGDLNVKANINTKDELQTLGEYFNKMVDNQHILIKTIRSNADELAASSQETSAASEEISAATQEIAASIQEVAKSAENQNSLIVETSEVLVQLSSLVQISQSKSLTAKTNSNHSMEVAQDGRIKVEKTVQAIENISKASTDTEDTLNVLSNLSEKVNGIITTINGISEQTNLLALNASIEAARAGEHGKGFTVVAEEVRKLSEETNLQSKEISILINEMLIQITKAVETMHYSRQAVENGAIIANETDKSFVTIISAVKQVVDDVNSIVDITKDEVASSDHIVKLIDSVATITESTTSNSEQVASASEEQAATVENVAEGAQKISDMAMAMDSLIEKFKV